ncbi:sodium/calcium exchanger 2 isoform X2 [Patella vulgata]|uniref:sodium/calcium exchanger 2 isoform X2 n=1 Tax=Patella vulgata TaxID=6465 RepID=UPI00217FC083|nr:sodium/calcium exchanger 2 isoform X2 [Patella vulgata]
MYHFTNFSRGYVAEFFVNESDICKSWLLLPAENLWPEWLRGVLYIAALIYLFMGIAIASDVFMCSIEVITSKKRIISYYDNEKGQNVEREVLLWNETVANLTLMALGSSAPEILLATIETVINLGSEKQEDALGTFTIIGSAAFNLLIITAICVVSVDSPDIKKIRELGVFVLTSIWSIWAYVWMLLVVSYITPGVVTLWEAWVTLAFFPIFVIMAYLQDHGWSCAKKVEGIENEDDDSGIRIVDMNRHGSLTGHVPKELQVLEQERAHRMRKRLAEKLHGGHSSQNTLNEITDNDSTLRLKSESLGDVELFEPVSKSGISPELSDSESTENVNGHGPSTHRVAVRKASNEPQVFARASENRFRFRHAAVSALMGGTVSHTSHSHSKLPHLVDVVAKMRILNEASKLGKAPEALERQILVSQKFEGDLTGKFTFASDRYAVLESAGMLEVDVLFHRHILSRGKLSIMNETVTYKNGDIHSGETEGVEMVKGVVSVDFETREGSAKPGKDYKYTTGTLIFKENEYKRTLLIPIINDNQYEADVDFYVILKNPKGGGGLGDPSVSRVTIVDDDEPGEFLFEEPHYQADMKKGQVTVKVMREHGYDGKVTIEYSTIDGTAHGGERLKPGVDYIVANGTINFSHSETSKTFSIPVNKDSKGALNFIIALRNPSLGAKIGERSATVCHINKDELIERLAEVLEDEEEKEVTWGSQFANAMTVGGDTDSEGNEVDPKWSHYLMHFFTFFWKLLCALIPPTNCLGAWPTFVFSLTVIAVLTAFVEQLGHLIGCVIGLRTSVTGITIIALGTSVPDTFASRTAAKQDTHADAAIGNVTGSNSVNVFLGLGLPWVIATVYAAISGTEYQVKTTNLTESVIIFSTCGTICIILLLLRRVFVGGELGGKDKIVKYASSIFLIGLWVIYILLASLVAYDYNIIPLPK